MTRPQEKVIRGAVPILIIIATAAVFLPALRNDFVNWDDYATVAENLTYRGLGRAQLEWMFTTFYMGHYQPLSWVTFGVDYLFWGMKPAGYHLTNIILHAVNAGIFYFLALRLLALAKVDEDGTRLRAGAAIAALFFSLHPLRVESVAWATERRDVLSGVFFLLTIIAYLKAATSAARTQYIKWISLTLAAYVLSLLSKAVGITLPAVLLILDVFPLKRLGKAGDGWFGPAARKVWLEKLPFTVLALGAAVTAAMAQYTSGAMDKLSKHDVIHRLAQASFGFWYYLEKTIFPGRLYPMYDLPTEFSPWDPVYIICFLGLAALIASLALVRLRWPAGLASALYYGAVIAPVSGIAQSGAQIVADRYSYLSCLVWALLAGGGALLLWRRWLSKEPSALFFAPAALIAVFFILASSTQRQIAVWHDSETLYRYVLDTTPYPSKIALNNLAGILAERGRFDEAIMYYRRAVEIYPAYDEAHSNLGNALAAQGKTEEAIAQYREALRIKPNSLVAHHNLGLALAKQGKLDEALEHYRKAVEINPGFLEGQNNLGRLLAARGEYAQAIQHYRKALEIDDRFPLAHANLGDALAAVGQRSEAIDQLYKALELDPDLDSARSSLTKLAAEQPTFGAARR